MTDDDLAAARVAPLEPPNDDVQRRIVDRVRVALSDARQGERVCAVCDEIVLKSESTIGRVCEQLCATMRRRCSPARVQPALPQSLIDQYDCSRVYAQLAGILLSLTAFDVARAELGADVDISAACVCGKVGHIDNERYEIAFPICNSCRSSLTRHIASGAREPGPPTLAIANGFVIGRLPLELRDASVHEVAMVAPSIVNGQVEVCVRVGRSNHIRSHITLFDSMPTPPVSTLPRSIDNAPTLLVRFVGPFTKDDIARKKMAFTIRRATIDSLFAFFRQHNSLDAYRSPLNAAAVAALPPVAAVAPVVHVQHIEDANTGLRVVADPVTPSSSCCTTSTT